AVLLAVAADAPLVIQVVALLLERVLEPDVLQEPVAPGMGGATAGAAVVVASILHENPNRFLLALADDVGVGVAAAKVGEAADEAQHLAKVVGAFPGDG